MMAELWGKQWTADALRRQVGTMAQVAGIRLADLADGKARGLRTAEVYTGSGLRFQVLLDRALDIGAADWGGRPLAWVTPSLGIPAQHEPTGFGWGRTWGGGLVTTAGLTHFGQPEQDGNETLGLHGRISHVAAEQVSVRTAWEGDEYVLEIGGQVRQAVPIGENLLLTRRIRTRLGSNTIRLEDTIRNEGFTPTPHMILYHCNFGFPLVSADSEMISDDTEVQPRDEAAAAGLDTLRRFQPPENGPYPEQVFFHLPRPAADGWARAALVNRALGLGVGLRWRAAELPRMGFWKQLAAGAYVCALEPANYWETPRHRLRSEGRLRHLAPGEEVQYALEFHVLPDAPAIATWEHGG
jgi:hypothetical protein